ncbi:alpha/beta hydrolase [uncultured Pseudokineococcus sp.]|uniref:alpha/beta hydrolase n=1 Tax=uncultured Pseudokineococcus sp. TaxID=1642928 RepID=UPI002602F45C|nr:alpha/beta fold hydrolase [uncultured Pseudokineococcus sp.]
MVETSEWRVVNGHRLFVAVHETGGEDVVVFCHGFVSSSTGPQRAFVRAARRLADCGISSLRFDQYGSGNSAGEYEESSFTDWCATITDLVDAELDRGRRVVLFGQSMGASAAIVVASQRPAVSGLVAWVPDPNTDPLDVGPDDLLEEAGQLVRARYWLEAREADVAACLRRVACQAYVVQCTEDALVDDANRHAIEAAARDHHVVDTWTGLPHSAWTHQQSTEIIERSVTFARTASTARTSVRPEDATD